ncbi:putative ABC transport system substrate-binding protein [Granulicatella balaenopterae]|uniref:Putative ABC transport system substrate-binding protein n=1 Tax=Granulicatella balaenopterae TaxID=137733 RepID=A0A1H9JLV5_9LACT|nr:ABC transporter substrate-binding protein [Granulicatella balaenopterae]SEQ87826.1 putative ABC transport system substrate-binding protein [Granulicatella balaenopterae]
MKKNLLKLLTIFCSLSLIAIFVSHCAKKDDNCTHIGILQFAEHDALTLARLGFVDELAANHYIEGENLILTIENASGDQSNLPLMAEKLADENNLNFAIATPAAQAMMNADQETPTIFTAISDPISAGLTDSLEQPSDNSTGTIDYIPVQMQIEKLLAAIPNAQTIGIFYNSNEVNSEAQARLATNILNDLGLTVIEKTVTTTNDVQQVVTSLAKEVDAIYFPTDTTVASTVAMIHDILIKAKVPAIGGDQAVLDATLLVVGVDYYKLGQQSAKQALQLLNGTAISDIAVEDPATPMIEINPQMAQALGFSLSELEERVH